MKFIILGINIEAKVPKFLVSNIKRKVSDIFLNNNLE